MGYNSVADIMGLSYSFRRCFPRKSRNSEKSDLTAGQGHPRSSIFNLGVNRKLIIMWLPVSH